MKNVNSILVEMMQEGTGKALCDSGDAYGRNWEHNQAIKDFDNLPTIEHDVCQPYDKTSEDISFSVNVYQYLKDILEIDKICEDFNAINIGADWDSDRYGCSQKAISYLWDIQDIKIGKAWNTYNGENCLSQVLQGYNVKIDGKNYVILQLHNGCDVRGGYTDARLFSFVDYEGYINPTPTVYGSVNNKQVDNCYNGWSLTDEDGQPVKLYPKRKNKIDLYLCEQ